MPAPTPCSRAPPSGSRRHFGNTADVFRFGGDAFLVLLRHAQEDAQFFGDELVKLCAAAYTQDGRSVFAPASVGVTVGHDARDAADLVRNASWRSPRPSRTAAAAHASMRAR